MTEITIKLSKDGNEYCALIGEDLEEGLGAFDLDPINAIRNLCDKLEFATDHNINLKKLIG